MNRRNFLRSTAVAAIALAIPTIGLAKPVPNKWVFVDFEHAILNVVRSRELKYLGMSEWWSVGKYRSQWMVEIYKEIVDANPNNFVVLRISNDYVYDGEISSFVRRELLEIAKHVVIEENGKLYWWKNRSNSVLNHVYNRNRIRSLTA